MHRTHRTEIEMQRWTESPNLFRSSQAFACPESETIIRRRHSIKYGADGDCGADLASGSDKICTNYELQ